MARSSPAATSRFSLFSGPAELARPRLLLVLSVFFLSVAGFVMVFSASSIEAINEGLDPNAYLVRHAVYLVVSVGICAFVSFFVPYEIWLGPLLAVVWVASFVLLVLTALMGTIGLGAQRWLSLGPFSFQPSEFVKVAIVLVAARIMYRARTDNIPFETVLLRFAVFAALPLLIVYRFQSDLGTTLICVVGIVAVLFLAGVRIGPMAVVLGIMLVFVFAAVFLVGYRSDRMSFLNPEADYYGAGYQLVRSFYAFGEGGLFGVGLGNSTEKYLYLPEAETDFIFAILAEETGLVGALLVVAAFLVLLWAGLQISRSAPDLFGSLLAGACTVMLVFQAFLNIACVTGLLPTTGKPLPFISSGGSSLMGSFILVGLILSVSLGSDASGSVFSRRRDDLRVVRSTSASSRTAPLSRSSSSAEGRRPKSGQSGSRRGAKRSMRR